MRYQIVFILFSMIVYRSGMALNMPDYGNCNVVAHFTMPRELRSFVKEGYTTAGFGKSSFKNVIHQTKKTAIPVCIAKALANTDSLNKENIKRVFQVFIKNRILYCFEKKMDKKLARCVDCARKMIFVNSDCKPEVTFIVGGIAGSKGNNGYSGSDYNRKKILQILWTAK